MGSRFGQHPEQCSKCQGKLTQYERQSSGMERARCLACRRTARGPRHVYCKTCAPYDVRVELLRFGIDHCARCLQPLVWPGESRRELLDRAGLPDEMGKG